LKSSEEENTLLKSKLLKAIEDMKKFEGRFVVEKEKWQNKLMEEV